MVAALSVLINEGLIKAAHGSGYYIQDLASAHKTTETIGLLYQKTLAHGMNVDAQSRVLEQLEAIGDTWKEGIRTFPYMHGKLFETYDLKELSACSALVFSEGTLNGLLPQLSTLGVPVMQQPAQGRAPENPDRSQQLI